MTNDQREIHRKKRVLEYADKVGNINKACRYFGVASKLCMLDLSRDFSTSSRKESQLMRYVFGLFFLFLVGCSHTSGQVLAYSDRSSGGLYYVQNQPKDARHLETILAEILGDRGLRTSAGTAADLPASTEFIVTYEDRWSWDMRLYLLDFTVQVRDVKTGTVLGFGKSYQDSLAAMGMTYRDVIERAVDQLLGSKK